MLSECERKRKHTMRMIDPITIHGARRLSAGLS